MTKDWKTWQPLDLDAHEPEFIEIDGVTLIPSGSACPEAYDVFLGDTRIGYMHLRGGRFYAAFPDVGGEIVYSHHFDDPWQGAFDPEERKTHLPLAIKALKERYERDT